MPPAGRNGKLDTQAAGSGVMQFGREQLLQVPPAMPPDGERGWGCRDNPEPFQVPFGLPPSQPADSPDLHPRWDDDGGAPAEKPAPRSPRIE